MRVIAGTYKGHQIQAVPNKRTRPTTDKVKEAIFQMIGPFFDGGLCLDLFAGSGGLGIEAISRGIDTSLFVDQQSQAIQTIHANIQTLHLEEQTEVYRTDAFRALKAASKRELVFDLIFLDPPYLKISYTKLLEEIDNYHLFYNQTIIVCEHEAKQKLPDRVARFEKFKSEVYGSTTGITLYQLGDGSVE